MSPLAPRSGPMFFKCSRFGPTRWNTSRSMAELEAGAPPAGAAASRGRVLRDGVTASVETGGFRAQIIPSIGISGRCCSSSGTIAGLRRCPLPAFRLILGLLLIGLAVLRVGNQLRAPPGFPLLPPPRRRVNGLVLARRSIPGVEGVISVIIGN